MQAPTPFAALRAWLDDAAAAPAAVVVPPPAGDGGGWWYCRLDPSGSRSSSRYASC